MIEIHHWPANSTELIEAGQWLRLIWAIPQETQVFEIKNILAIVMLFESLKTMLLETCGILLVFTKPISYQPPINVYGTDN